MELQEALRLIQAFWQEPEWPFQPAPEASAHIIRLQADFSRPLPPWLAEYLTQAAPIAKYTSLDTVGNPLELYGLPQLGYRQDGYNFNSVTQKVLPDWPDHWFMLGDEGADPILVDLTGDGAGSWDYGADLAASIGQFLLCAAARQHALRHFGDAENGAILDDAQGFRLVPDAAAWLFPRMRRWAGPYYDAWTQEFDNARQY